jgi:hypothetical protein
MGDEPAGFPAHSTLFETVLLNTDLVVVMGQVDPSSSRFCSHPAR